MKQYSVRMDEELKKETDLILSDLGLNFSVAVNMFAKQIVKRKAIPFSIELQEKDAISDMTEEEIRNGLKKIDKFFEPLKNKQIDVDKTREERILNK